MEVEPHCEDFQGADVISCHWMYSSGNQENCFHNLSSGMSQHQGLSWLKCLFLVEIGFRNCFSPLFLVSSLCNTGDVFCLSMGFGLAPLESHRPSRWKWDSESNPCSQRQKLFLTGKQGASFAYKSVSISSPTPNNYVSLSFTQLPATPFQCSHLWLPINKQQVRAVLPGSPL